MLSETAHISYKSVINVHVFKFKNTDNCLSNNSIRMKEEYTRFHSVTYHQAVISFMKRFILILYPCGEANASLIIRWNCILLFIMQNLLDMLWYNLKETSNIL